MTDTTDLIRRLRERASQLEGLGHAAMAGECREAADALEGAAETIAVLQAQVDRANGANDLLCEIIAARRGDGSSIASAPEEPSARVIRWLKARFAERPEGWPPEELLPLAHNAGHSLAMWFDCPEVIAMIDKTQYAELWKGRPEPVWRLKDGEDKP